MHCRYGLVQFLRRRPIAAHAAGAQPGGPWEKVRIYMGFIRKSMGKPWENVGKPWENNENIWENVAKQWEY